jgi:hypothetical protein
MLRTRSKRSEATALRSGTGAFNAPVPEDRMHHRGFVATAALALAAVACTSSNGENATTEANR